MRLQLRVFGSRVARRVFASFVLASAVPLIAVAVLVVTQVGNTLEENAFDDLENASRGYGQLVLDKLLSLTALLPHSNPGVMGRGDLQRLKEFNPSLGLMLESVSERLLLAGAAHDNAPDKKPAVRLRTLELAGELRIPFTTGILIGIGENWQERIDSLIAIRELHERHGHIQEVIVQNFRAKPTIPMRDHPDASKDDMVKTIAIARLILGGEMNIQAPPNLTPDGYEFYLDAGINDWGGVSPLTPDFINPEAPWPALQLLQQKSAQAGFELRARLPVYPEYIHQGDKFLAPSTLPFVESLCGADGLVKDNGPLANFPTLQHFMTPSAPGIAS